MPRDDELEVYHGRAGTAEQQQLVRARIDALCRSARGSTVLDMRCGEGLRCLLLARAEKRVTGIDPDPVAVMRARKHLEGERLEVQERVDVQHLQASVLPFPDGSFDSVLLDRVLPHLLEPDPVLREAARVARADGVVILTARLGVTRHRDHEDALGAERLAAMLAPHLTAARAEMAGEDVLIVSSPGASDPAQVLAVMLPAVDQHLRSLSAAQDEARDRIVTLEAEVTSTRAQLDAERKRARRFKEAYERQRRHWSWRFATRLNKLVSLLGRRRRG